MNIVKGFIAFLLCFCILSCSDILKKSKETIWLDRQHRYTLYEATDKNAETCNELSLITPERNYDRLTCITSIGDDDHFIIIQTLKRDSVQYWIINKDKDREELLAKDILDGPFDLPDFIVRKSELGIDTLGFQKDIK